MIARGEAVSILPLQLRLMPIAIANGDSETLGLQAIQRRQCTLEKSWATKRFLQSGSETATLPICCGF